MTSNQVAVVERAAANVTFKDNGDKIVLDNGIVQLTISKPIGIITGIKYGGIDNLLETLNDETNRGYWDLNWSEPDGKTDNFDVPHGTTFKLVVSTGDKVEVSFTRTYDAARDKPMVPLTIDKRFALLKGSSGFFTYGIYKRESGWRDFNLNQTRVVFKLRKDRFRYMGLADNKLRLMPTPDDLSDARSEELAYKEARRLTNPISDSSLKGDVDDKYCYSLDNSDNKLHGWVSLDPQVGFWMITPSNEFRNGGPTKQDLTSHVGQTCLSMFHSAHYAGIDLCMKIRDKDAWSKVFGPVFVYLNSASKTGTGLDDVRTLWNDAKNRMKTEISAWPYSWPSSSDYAQAKDRGQISGRLVVSDSYAEREVSDGANAYLGLALPGETGSWQRDSKGYQFWAQADSKGNFTITNVVPGKYNLYGWVPGVIGDYRKAGNPIVIAAGDKIALGDETYKPPRHGTTLWEIGYPDRTAAGYIPDGNPDYVNKLFVNHPDKWRQYGLWTRYAELYPDEDLIYTVGKSDVSEDWYFAHTCRRTSDATLAFKTVTWQIRFNLSTVEENGLYKLRLGFAGSNAAAIAVRVNDLSSDPVYETPTFGKDNLIARHGNHGLYSLYTADISGKILTRGENTIYLTQTKANSSFTGVIYDFLRLESAPKHTKLLVDGSSSGELAQTSEEYDRHEDQLTCIEAGLKEEEETSTEA